MTRHRLIACGIAALSSALFASFAHAASGHITLRTDCSDATVTCYTTVAQVVNHFWGGGTVPTANNPGLVDVGPGIHTGTITCSGASNGYVNFRGLSRASTVVSGSPSAFDIDGCVSIRVNNLAAEGTEQAVSWKGLGSSSWHDVDLRSPGGTNGAAWRSDCDGSSGMATHNFYKSTMTSTGGAGEQRAAVFECARVDFYAGSVLAETASGGGLASAIGIEVGDDTDVDVFGAVVGVRAASDLAPTSGELVGVAVETAGDFQMHGGSIEAIGSSAQTTALDAVGLRVDGGTGNANSTAFRMDARSGGQSIRLESLNSGVIEAPMLWPPALEPPDVITEPGQDLFVETNCAANGDCGTWTSSHLETHLMIYTPACTGTGLFEGPWFNVATGACRGVLVP